MRSFPALDTAVEWLENYGGGKYFVKLLTLGKCKLGYMSSRERIKSLRNESTS